MVDGAREPLEDEGVAWLQLVAANTPDAITILAPDGRILYANHLAGRRDPLRVIGQDSAELVPTEHQPRWRATLQAAIETCKTQTLEITSVSGFSWLSRLVPIVSAGRVASVLCVGSDLSDLRRAQAFEPFFTTKKPGKGTGLGLSVVRAVVQQHHGRIHIDSTPGVGTTFSVYWPISQVEARPSEAVPAPKPHRGKETILVAEDDELVRHAVVTALKRAGHEVLACADGVEALAMYEARADDIALLVIDGLMPRKSGIEVYREVLARKPDQLVILSSGYSEAWPETYEHLRGLRLLQKPYTPAMLLQTVRELLELKWA